MFTRVDLGPLKKKQVSLTGSAGPRLPACNGSAKAVLVGYQVVRQLKADL